MLRVEKQDSKYTKNVHYYTSEIYRENFPYIFPIKEKFCGHKVYFNSLAVMNLPGFSSGPACGDLMVQCRHQDFGAIENHHALMSRIRRNAYGTVCNFQS